MRLLADHFPKIQENYNECLVNLEAFSQKISDGNLTHLKTYEFSQMGGDLEKIYQIRSEYLDHI